MTHDKYTTEALRAELNDIIEDGIIAIKNMHSGDSYRLKDTTETELIIFVNYMQAALLDEVGRRLPEWEYKKLEPCPVCGDYQYSHSPGSHHDYAINQVRGILEAIRKEIV